MKRIGRTSDKVLLWLCIVSFAVYAVIFFSAFAELPLNIPSWHQGLLLFFHAIPMFFLELLLCRIAALRWRLLLPAFPLILVGVWFLSRAEWYVMAWILFLAWCVPPVAGCLAACAVFAVCRHGKR